MCPSLDEVCQNPLERLLLLVAVVVVVEEFSRKISDGNASDVLISKEFGRPDSMWKLSVKHQLS